MIHQLPLFFLAQINADALLEHVLPHRLVQTRWFTISNHTVMVFSVAIFMVLLFAFLGTKAKKPVPTGFHNLFEAVLSFLRTEIIRPALGDNTDRFVPYLWTVFFFVLFCNLFGLVPIGSALGLVNPHWSHIGGTATGNLAVTAALAILAFIVIHLSGIIQQVRIQMDPSLNPHHTIADHLPIHGHGGTTGGVGVDDERDVVLDHYVGDGHDHAHHFHHAPQGKPFASAVPAGIGMYLWNFAPHPQVGNKVADFALFVMLLGLELFGALVKPFALAVRLFANMLAGHMVLATLVALIPFTAGAAWMLGISVPVIIGSTMMSAMELFVACLQAYIFTFLTTLFIASAVAPEH